MSAKTERNVIALSLLAFLIFCIANGLSAGAELSAGMAWGVGL